MTNPFSLTVRRETDGVAVIATDGYVNNQGGEQIGEAASSLITEGYRKLVVNMEKSTVINSIGISILIEVLEKLQEVEGTLVFCHLTRTIAKTFQIMGLTQYAELADTEADALEALKAVR